MAAKKKRRKSPTRAPAAKRQRPGSSSKPKRAAPKPPRTAPPDPWDDVPDDPETLFHLKEAARHFDAAYNVRRPRRR